MHISLWYAWTNYCQDTTNRQGSNTGHGSIDVCRGKEAAITIDNVTNTGVAYDLFGDTGTAGTSKRTAAEGSSGQVTYNGSAVTLTFTPNATTPNTVYIRNNPVLLLTQRTLRLL